MARPATRLNAVAQSVDGLRLQHAHMSASRVLSGAQLGSLAVVGLLGVAGLVLAPVGTLIGLNALVIGVYVMVLVHSLLLWRGVVRGSNLIAVDDLAAGAFPDGRLPVFTVLVAAFQEKDVIADTIRSLERLDYPEDRLDVKLLLEADDRDTIDAALAASPRPNVEIVIVPQVFPRTKPKALNFGLTRARGELVTVYDAEDRPDPLQLRKAAIAFSQLPRTVACLQARLEYHNAQQNRLTRWFAVEYLTWFGRMLPAVAAGDTPVPLGGTSMHLRRDVLEAIGAWDPYNVTEDADLGVRLYRMGYRTAILDSPTLEEANSDFVNWVKQRSRWYKGFVQTWLVHMRNPLRLRRELGTSGFAGFNALVGATSLVALLNPVFWVLTAMWFVGRPDIINQIYPDWLYFPGLVSMLFGNFFAYYTGLITIRASDRPDLLRAALTYPLYWAMMSIGAVRAFLQLLVAPFFWEKTTHGLDRPVAAVEAA
jgi:cellulose synthase/poly-beta-1,6-N-acetylglucosamine synthase-like glycosyltransferase